MARQQQAKNAPDPFDDTVPSAPAERARIVRHDLIGLSVYGVVELLIVAAILTIVALA